ncbi:ABC transporter permease [Paenibacillus humicola]|uniref:ABC transporter permease n=1 Tax=Paenibacillus humicola TaxID=3110540 RepID=UPI00237A68F2|nr:ABC transporter permease [Paenibacillus humicola]
MNLLESILVSLESLRDNKFRSFLTMIGIVVGVAAVVTVVSVGQAGKSSIVSDIDNYGEGFFIVVPDSSQGISTSERLVPTLEDVKALSRNAGVAAISGQTNAVLEGKANRDDIRFSLSATTADRVKVENIKLTAGRFFTGSEERSRRKVLVVESNYAETYFGTDERAIGRKVQMNGSNYQIVGVYETPKGLFSIPTKNQYSAYVPIETVSSALGGGVSRLSTLYVRADSGDAELMARVIDQVKSTLASRHQTTAAAYFSQTGEEAQNLVGSVFSILQIIIGSIAGISLLVGGIGVMNIMLVSVTERTREIGIRKAIGATPGVILWQFIVEAVVLCFMGGILGALLGLGGAYLFSLITKWPFLVSWWAVLLAFGFSAGIGLFFGIYPASKAARMQPIESLRYE